MTANPFAKSVNPTPLQQARVSKRLTPGQNGTKGLGLFDVCPQRRRPVLTHMGVRADVE